MRVFVKIYFSFFWGTWLFIYVVFFILWYKAVKNFLKYNFENVNCKVKYDEFVYMKIKYFCGYIIRRLGYIGGLWEDVLMDRFSWDFSLELVLIVS